jgi:hypothetical protein
MFGATKERELVPVNEHPNVLAMRERLLAARKDLEKWEAEELRLKRVLDPLPESAAYSPPPVTVQDIREARERLRADLGVTVPGHFYLTERRAAQRAVEDLDANMVQVREQAQRELVIAVKERAGRIAKEFATALAPCQELALELSALQEESGVNVPCVHSCLPYSSVANELHAVREWGRS